MIMSMTGTIRNNFFIENLQNLYKNVYELLALAETKFKFEPNTVKF